MEPLPTLYRVLHDLQEKRKQHDLLKDHVNELATTKKLNVTIAMLLDNEVSGNYADTLSFSIEEEIPPEFLHFLNEYATRLIAEGWLLDHAIDKAQTKIHEYESYNDV